MAGGEVGGSFICGAALAEPGAGAVDAGGWSGDGVAVRAGEEYSAAGFGAGRSGSAGVVGVSAGVAPLDEGGAGLLDVSPVNKGKGMSARRGPEPDWEGKPIRYEVTTRSDGCHTVLCDMTQFSTVAAVPKWNKLSHR